MYVAAVHSVTEVEADVSPATERRVQKVEADRVELGSNGSFFKQEKVGERGGGVGGDRAFAVGIEERGRRRRCNN